jgi:hypothetical protein
METKRAWVLIIGVFLIFAAAAVALVLTVRSATERAMLPFQQGSQALGTQVAQVLHPTPTVLPDPVTIVNQVRNLSRLETIQYSVEKVITAETAQGAFALLFGDKLLLVAHGTVIAGIDLGKLKPGDITFSQGVVTVHLPPPEIFAASLDNQKSYVYDRTTGALTHGDTNLETTARRAAEEQIRQAALDDGILYQAQANAETFLTKLIQQLGYRDVQFIESQPLPTPYPSPVGFAGWDGL